MRTWLFFLAAISACVTPHGASRSRDASFRELIAKDPEAVRECHAQPALIVDVTPSLPLCRDDEEPFPARQCLPFTGRPGENTLCRVGDPECCQVTASEQVCVREREYRACEVLRYRCDAQNGCAPTVEERATFNRG